MLLGYGYMRNNLVRLGEYPTHRDVADMSNLFYLFILCLYDQGDDSLTEISPFQAKLDEQKSI